MRVLFAGTPQVAVPALAALLASDHEVVGVLTRADAASGRGRKLTPSPVRVAAQAAGLPVITAKPADPDFAPAIRALDAEIAAVVAYGHLLKPAILAVLPFGWLNLHFSLLPAWRGAAPVQHAIIAGDSVTGASVFLLDEGMDTGPVYASIGEPIGPDDTTGTLLDRLAVSGAELLVGVISQIAAGQLTPVPQVGVPILAPKLNPPDAQVDWTQPAIVIDRLIRGCTPAPGAWTTLPDGLRLGLAPGKIRPDVAGLAPGEMQIGKQAVLVGTGSVAVELGLVRPVGKQPMAAEDWARGARLPAEVRLG